MPRKILVAVFLLVPVAVIAQNNTVEIKKIEKQIKSFEKSLATFEKFSENLLAEASARGLPVKEDLLLKLLAFDVNILDLRFNILITKGILKSSDGSVPEDSLVELQLDLLKATKKPPIEFAKDMLPIIKESINSLKKEKDLIEKKSEKDKDIMPEFQELLWKDFEIYNS